MLNIARKLALSTLAFMLATIIGGASIEAMNRYEEGVSLPSVVQVNGGCSGFIGDFNFVMTAKHCLAEAGPIQIVKFYDGLQAHFIVVAQGSDQETHDFAILMGDTRGLMPMQLTSEVPEPHELCVHVGHGGASPQQLLIPCSLGERSDAFEDYIVVNSTAIPGDSGSMVVNEEMEVFGILTRSRFPIPTTLAVRMDQVIEALKEFKEKHGVK